MAAGSGEAVANDKKDKESKGDPKKQQTDYQKLIAYGLDAKVAKKLDEIYVTGKLAHVDLDERALDALKEFPVDGALVVLKQFLDSNLEHVSNKSAYLCGVMKTYRQKSRLPTTTTTSLLKGPNEENIKKILERTGYKLDVTTGQRKYGGPPPESDENSLPGNGCEIFVGRIPKDLFEDELIPLFENCGKIWDLRLMMDPLSGQNRGYAFITYCDREEALKAVQQLDEYEIRKDKHLKVNISVPNLRLFVGNIPKVKGKEEIFGEFCKLAAGLLNVIIYSSPNEQIRNRGFCFLEYESHKAASLAKRRLGSGRVKVWGCDIIVDWADAQEEPDHDTMSKVKVLYVRNLKSNVTEDKLKETFDEFGKVYRVKKIKDYAFVHFEDRDSAVKAMETVNGKDIGGSALEVSLAKPPTDKRKKEDQLRARERRMMGVLHQKQGSPRITHPHERTRIRLQIGREFDYNYDYYGYGDYRGGYADPYYDYYRYDDYYDCGYGLGLRGRYNNDRFHGRQASFGGVQSSLNSRQRGRDPRMFRGRKMDRNRGNLTSIVEVVNGLKPQTQQMVQMHV